MDHGQRRVARAESARGAAAECRSDATSAGQTARGRHRDRSDSHHRHDVQYEWDFVNGKRVGRGYVARNTIEVRVDAIDRVGEFLEIAAGAGATALGGIRFDLKDQAKLEREALRLAVLDARAKADAAAAGAGRIVDRILRVEEAGVEVPPMPVRMMRQAAQATVADAAPPISAGQLEIRARATVTAALK